MLSTQAAFPHRFNQPLQHRVRVHLEHPATARIAEPFGQRAHGPYQQPGRHVLAIQRRAMGIQEKSATGGAVQLPLGPATRMTVGAEIAEPHPATIVTVWMVVEVGRGVHLASMPTRGGDPQGWRGR